MDGKKGAGRRWSPPAVSAADWSQSRARGLKEGLVSSRLPQALENVHIPLDTPFPVSPDRSIRYSQRMGQNRQTFMKPCFPKSNFRGQRIHKRTKLSWNKHPFCLPTPWVSNVANYVVCQMLSCVYMTLKVSARCCRVCTWLSRLLLF